MVSSRRGRRWAGAALLLAVLAGVIVAARTDMPSREFATRACQDLLPLLRQGSTASNGEQDPLVRAMARARRAATTDGSFDGLHQSLRVVRDAVMDATDPPAAQRRTAQALGRIDRACVELGVPLRVGDRSLDSLSVDDLRRRLDV